MQHTIESYKKWKRDFKNVHGKEALNALKMEFGTDDNYQLLEGLILENCYFAFHYEKESDINVVNRRKWGQELTKEINRQINDAKRIRDFAKRNPLVPGYGFQFGLGKNPNLEFSWRGEGPYPFSKALEAVLDQYIGILEKPNPIINSDNATHRNHIGALIFPNEPNNKSRFNKLNPLVNSLTYKLIDVFKNHTAGWEGPWYEMSRPLLPHGEPCLKFVTEFVAAVLQHKDNNPEKAIGEENLRQVMDNLDSLNVRVCHWFSESAYLEILRAGVNNKKPIFQTFEDS